MSRKLRLFSAVLALVLACAAFGRINVVQAQGGVPDATVKTSLLLMRDAPNRKGNVVANLTDGTGLTLDGRDQAMSWVHGKTDAGQIGWVSRYYLAYRNGFDVKTLPVLGAAAPVTTTTTSGNNAAPITVAGKLSGNFEVGGQVQGLDGATIAAMKQAKMTWVKFQVGVGDNVSGLIGAGHAAGFHVLLSVKGDKNSVLTPGYFDRYAGYVGTAAQQGADAIEVWNEANLDREWPTGHIDPGLYTQLLAQSYNVIKRVSPNTMVISGAPSPTGAGVGANYWNDDVFYAGMAKAGAGRYADCIGVHYNEGIVPPSARSGGWLNYPTNYFDTMLARALASFPGKKACFTELGYLSGEGFGGLPGGFAWAGNVSVANQAAWLAQAAVRASGTGRVRLMIVWNVNIKSFGDDPQAGYAMIRPDGSCPACATLGSVR